MATINVQQHFTQSPEQVFAVLGTHAGLGVCFAPLQVTRIQDSADTHHPDGVGSVRKMGIGSVTPLYEQVTEYEPNKFVEYVLINNPLIKHHVGRLIFTPEGSGTLLNYTIELEGKIPGSGTVILAGLKVGIQQGLKKLAKSL